MPDRYDSISPAPNEEHLSQVKYASKPACSSKIQFQVTHSLFQNKKSKYEVIGKVCVFD